MPYACLLLPEALDASLRETGAKIAASSAFVAASSALHVPVFGTLHSYSDEEVDCVLKQPHPVPVRGRLLNWDIIRDELRAFIEFTPDFEVLTARLQSQLPRGKPWGFHYVVLGSVEAIGEAQRDEFLAAVRQAFPIDGTTLFACAPSPRLEYHNLKKAKKVTPQPLPPQPVVQGFKTIEQEEIHRQRLERKARKAQQREEKLRQQASGKLMSRAQRQQAGALLVVGHTLSRLRKRCSATLAQQRLLRAAAVQKARERGLAKMANLPSSVPSDNR